MKIKACIPHYFSKSAENDLNLPGNWIPGSARGDVEKRKKSFRNCLLSLIHTSKVNNYGVLNIQNGYSIDRVQNPSIKNDITITILTDGKNICDEILDRFENFIEVKELTLDDPRDLIFESREYLLSQEDYDLYYYSEDDLGPVTRDYFERVLWFAEETNHKSVLMPHRFENPHLPEIEKLYTDGPIDQNFLKKFMIPKQNAVSLTYKNNKIYFDKPLNPHSGTFCLSSNQRNFVCKNEIKRRDDFVSRFESVCTLTPMEFFEIYKPSWKYRTFLEVEHYFTNCC